VKHFTIFASINNNIRNICWNPNIQRKHYAHNKFNLYFNQTFKLIYIRINELLSTDKYWTLKIIILTEISHLILKMWLWNPSLSPTSVLWKNAIFPFGMHGYFQLRTTKLNSIDVTCRFLTGELAAKIYRTWLNL